ncbi:MAG: hypothetical protein Q4E22_02525 [Coriobacteriia bacterium]|nr:hypothetical protein [Coriobacteriia bacterium]
MQSKKAPLTISRRQALVGAGSVMFAASAAGMFACSKTPEAPDLLVQDSLISDDNFIDMMAYEAVDVDAMLENTYHLPLGSVLFATSENYGAVLSQNDVAVPISQIGLLNLKSGDYSVIHKTPTSAQGYEFMDVRTSDDLMVWTELNFHTSEWALFAQNHNAGQALGEITKLDQGDKNTLIPNFAVWRHQVYWQRMPNPNGDHKTQDSILFMWSINDANAKEIWRSSGHFATPPTLSKDFLVITPRVLNQQGTHYGVTGINCVSNKMFDQFVLPKSVKPSTATYLDGNFAISNEASYGFGGLLGSMGTFLGRGGKQFLACTREPYATAVQTGNRICIKNRGSMLIFNPQNESFYRLPATNNSMEWGDFPAAEGLCNKLFVYATTKDPQTGLPAEVTVRSFVFPEAGAQSEDGKSDKEPAQIYHQAPITVVNPDGTQTTINPEMDAFVVKDPSAIPDDSENTTTPESEAETSSTNETEPAQ